MLDSFFFSPLASRGTAFPSYTSFATPQCATDFEPVGLRDVRRSVKTLHQPVFICVCVPHSKQMFAPPVRLSHVTNELIVGAVE